MIDYQLKLEESLQREIDLKKTVERVSAERDAARENFLRARDARDAAEIKLGKISAAVENPMDSLSALKYIRELLKPGSTCTGCGGTGRLADHPCPAWSKPPR
jgi:hypothetical protein